MRFRALCLAGTLTVILPGYVVAKLSDPNAIFSEAVQLDLGGDANASQAFQLYLKAADGGLPAAQFNVGVMLDSGRGTARDLAKAAVWYARAAAHENKRAAYNLAQLYQTGQGVPKNLDVARTWFQASELPAAKSRISELRVDQTNAGPLRAPTCVSPLGGARIQSNGVELVWLAPPQGEHVRFFVEVRSLTPPDSAEVFSGFTERTSILAPSHLPAGDYTWRVLAIGRRAGTYVGSEWSNFIITAN